MRAVGLRVRGALRRRWVAVLGVAVIVAIVSGAVLTLVAGARRTASTPAAFTRAVGGDVDASLQQSTGAPRTAEVRALPGVKSVSAMTFAFVGLVPEGGKPLDNAISFIGQMPSSARLLEGRQPDPQRAHEFIASTDFVAASHARIGDRFTTFSWTQAQADHGQGFNAKPSGPSFKAELVGIFQSSGSLEDQYSVAVFSPALLHADIGLVTTLTSVRLDEGVTRADLRAALDKLPNGRTISVGDGVVISTNVRNGIDAEARGIALMALVAALAAIVALGQLLSRHARLPEADRRALGALGYSRPQIGAETIARAAVPAIAGVVAGALAAILASGLFPPSFVRAIEPDPGIHVDVTALAVGGALLVVALLGWVAIALVTSNRVGQQRGRARTSTAIANRAPSAAAATGTNFALTGREGSTAASLGTIAALALIVTGLVGATAFAVSLDNLVSEPSRFGMNFTYSVGDNSPLNARDLREKLASDRDIDGMMILSAGQARAGDATVLLTGLDRVRGDLAPHVLSGRLPENADEVALGRITGRQLHRGVGDELALRGSAGAAKLRVVGIVVVPTVGGNDGVGNGALVTLPGLARLDSEPSASLAALTLTSDASPDARKEIERRTGAPPGLESRPGAIINVSRVRHIPAILAGLLGALALLTMIHALVVSIQSRRRDVAVLRALGADRRWVARTVHWQATVLTVVPLVVAIPLGLLAGAVVYRAFVDRIGALPNPSLPGLLLTAMVIALVVIANLAALWPARRARRVRAATLLQSE